MGYFCCKTNETTPFVPMSSALVLDILRTPIGRYGGSLASVRPDDLLAHALRELIKRNPEIAPEWIEDVVAGAANQSGEDNRNVARMALLLAGLPTSIGGVTVNRLCASGLQAIMDASRGTLGWRFTNPALAKMYHPFTMGETAENVADKWKITRESQDAFALQSQQRYAQAHAANRFAGELISVPVKKGKDVVAFEKDEYPRETSLEKLATLKPAFREGGSVTAGNSSGLNDGAAAALLVSESMAGKLKKQPMARVVSMTVAGVDPAFMGVGPVPAVKKALARAGLRVANIGLVELNEAFASQALACIRDLELDPEKVNVNGGAIALGHPLGCSGVRISATLLHEMQKQNVRYGVATMCIGVGQGAAVVYENMRI